MDTLTQGTTPFYYQEAIDDLVKQRDELLKSLNWALSVLGVELHEWLHEENADAHEAALALAAELEDECRNFGEAE